MTYTYFDHSKNKKEIFLSTNVKELPDAEERKVHVVRDRCCRSGLILKNCELDLKKNKNPKILFNFLTQIGTLTCILLFFFRSVLFLPVLLKKKKK